MADTGADVRRLALRTLGPTVAFSRRDTLADGYDHACAAARDLGFIPAVRPVGGTFAPIHGGSLIVDHYGVATDTWQDMDVRFARHSAALVDALRSLGIDARVGEVAGEYCPGRYSVNARGVVKVSGTAQRSSRGAWLVSSVVQVGDPEPLAEVTRACADALGRLVDTAVTGSVATETGRADPAVVGRAIVRTFRDHDLIGLGGVAGLSALSS